jgi:hypothetical protein
MKGGKFFEQLIDISFSRSPLLHGVSYTVNIFVSKYQMCQPPQFFEVSRKYTCLYDRSPVSADVWVCAKATCTQLPPLGKNY